MGLRPPRLRLAVSFAALAAHLALAACRAPSAAGADDAGTDAGDGGDAGVDAGTLSCVPDGLPGPLEQAAWEPGFTVAGVSGPDGIAPMVYDFAREPDGGTLAVGKFQWLGEERVEPMLRFRDGRWEPARTSWEIPPPADGFSAVAVDDAGKLALATHFDAPPADPQPRRGEIWVDSGSGLKVVGHFTGLVRRMAWFGGALWVAGAMTMDEGGGPGLALWDGSAWSGPPGGDSDGWVFELERAGSSLLVGGAFTTVGGIAAHKVAEWDGSAWKGYDLPFGVAVFGLARTETGDLYAGGSTATVPEAPVGGVMRWTGAQWELVGGGLGMGFGHGMATDVIARDGSLYVSGSFTSAGGGSEDPGAIRARDVARWNGSAWEALDDDTRIVFGTWYQEFARGDESPLAPWSSHKQRLFDDGTRLFLGGNFPGVAGVASQSLIAYDGQGWIPQGAAPGAGVSGRASAFAVGGPGCDVYALGTMTHASGRALPSRVARFSEGAWTPLPGELPAGTLCQRLAVNRAGTAFLGCEDPWPDDGSLPTGRVMANDGTGWVTLGTPFPSGVMDVAVDASDVLWAVGGSFEAGFVARWDGDHFTTVEDGFNAYVFRIFLPTPAPGEPTRALVGGAFTHIDDRSVPHIARWDGIAWSAPGGGLPSQVLAVAQTRAGRTYAALEYDGAPGSFLLAELDGSQWREIGANGLGLPDASQWSPRSLVPAGDLLLVGGNAYPHHVFAYDGTRFNPLAGGVRAIGTDALFLTRDSIWVGGAIAEAGPVQGRVPSVGVARLRWDPP